MSANSMALGSLSRMQQLISWSTDYGSDDECWSMPEGAVLRTKSEQEVWEKSTDGNLTLNFMRDLSLLLKKVSQTCSTVLTTYRINSLPNQSQTQLECSAEITKKDTTLLYIDLLRFKIFDNEKSICGDRIAKALKDFSCLKKEGTALRRQTSLALKKTEQLLQKEQTVENRLINLLGSQKWDELKSKFESYWKLLDTDYIDPFREKYNLRPGEAPPIDVDPKEIEAAKWREQQMMSRLVLPDFQFKCSLALIGNETLPTLTIKNFDEEELKKLEQGANGPVSAINRIRDGKGTLLAIAIQMPSRDKPNALEFILPTEVCNTHYGYDFFSDFPKPTYIMHLVQGLDIYRARKKEMQQALKSIARLAADVANIVTQFIPPQEYANIEEIES